MLAKKLNQLDLGLSHKYLLGLVSGLFATLFAFILLFTLMYQARLESGQAQASNDITNVMLAAMEQPLMARDDLGMVKLIDRLVSQSNITNVMLANSIGSIRFSSLSELIGVNPLVAGSDGCIQCHDQPAKSRPKTIFLRDELGREVLRSVSPIPNVEGCSECHGSAEEHPYTGMLVVDFDAGLLRREAGKTTFLLMSTGSVVLFITLWGGWWFMRHVVIAPVMKLNRASDAVSRGKLDTRVETEGGDELAQLGRTFNRMAENLEQAMAELKETEAFQQALIDAIPDGIRVIDSDFRIVAANRAYRDQHEIRTSDRLDFPCYQSSHDRESPCVPTLVTCPLHELKSSPVPIKFLDRHRDPSGTEFEVEVYAAPLLLQKDSTLQRYIVESIRDLSQQIQYSQEQKLSDLGRLAAGVAHEILNPLTTLQMALPHLGNSGTDATEKAEYLDLITREIDRCINVNQRLLKLSTRPPSQSELVSLNAAVEETLSLLNFEAAQRGVELDLKLDPDSPRALATDAELRMIVLNLVQNAFHALDDKGRILVATSSQGEFLCFSVDDSGHGISDSDLPRVFDPFFSHRVDGTEGSGLGLPITKSLVTKHGGTIRVGKSKLGGARFEVMLRNADYLQDQET